MAHAQMGAPPSNCCSSGGPYSLKELDKVRNIAYYVILAVDMPGVACRGLVCVCVLLEKWQKI